MEKFEIKDYSRLENSSKNIIDTANSMTSNLEETSKSMQSVYNEDTFYGPIADHCAAVLDIINRATVNNIDNFVATSKTIDKINQNYQETDKKVEEDIGGV